MTHVYVIIISYVSLPVCSLPVSLPLSILSTCLFVVNEIVNAASKERSAESPGSTDDKMTKGSLQLYRLHILASLMLPVISVG